MAKHYPPRFRAQVALEAIREEETMEQIAEKYGTNKSQVSRWKAWALDNFVTLFETDDQASQRKKAIRQIEAGIEKLKAAEEDQ